MGNPSIAYRTTHLPLTYGRFGPFFQLIPNRAAALYFLEQYPIDQTVTTFKQDVVRQHEEFDAPAIAYNRYGETDWYYWWALCFFNGVMIPRIDLSSGTSIKVPDVNQLKVYLNLTNQRKQQLIGDFTVIS